MSTDLPTAVTEFALVTIENPNAEMGTDPTETAIYTRPLRTGNWTLMSVEPGAANGVYQTTRLLGAPTRNVRNIVHLRTGGEWMTVVPDHLMAETTPRQQIETEIADLRAEAKRRAESAGYSGSYDDGGAGYLNERADGMQHVLDVLDAADEN